MYAKAYLTENDTHLKVLVGDVVVVLYDVGCGSKFGILQNITKF